MKLIEANWNPTARQLRQFGAVCLVAAPLLGWIWGGSWQTIGLLGAIGCAVALVGAIAPSALKPVYVALMAVTMPIGIVIGEVSLVLIFFGVFLPVALIFRAFRRDALELKVDRHAASYWKLKKQPVGLESYYRQS